jgi:type II protein arginine methyltransferase
MIILEITSKVSVEVLNTIRKEFGYDLGACRVLKRDDESFKNGNLSAALPVSSLNINSIRYASQLAGIACDWVDLDSTIESIRNRSELILKKEIEWSTHIGLPFFIFEMKLGDNFAGMVGNACNVMVYSQVLLRVSVGEWDKWNKVRFLCNHNSKLGIVLLLDEPQLEDDVLNRWLGEPIKMVSLPSRMFLVNKKGFPVLSKQYQDFVFTMMDRSVDFIISVNNEVAHHPKCTLKCYQEYIHYLESSKPLPGIIDQFAMGYHDVLQAPLQVMNFNKPLLDNLESGTYEVFEKDPVKYQLYEDAITSALLDWPDKTVIWFVILTSVVMIVGAGRGPLVDRALKASVRANQKVRVYCIEKNSNAIITYI